MVDAVTALPLIAANSMDAIGVSSLARNPLAPNVPTIAESGFPGFEATTDWALLAPAGTPAPILARLNAATITGFAAPDVAERLRQASIIPTVGSAVEFAAYLTAETTKWGEVIRARGSRWNSDGQGRPACPDARPA